jgi:hypothetical protein
MSHTALKAAGGVLALLTICSLLLGTTAMTSPETAPASAAETDFAAILDRHVEPPPAGRFAVIIGIVYPDQALGTIKYADRDARSLYDLLTGRMGYRPEDVTLLVNREATRANIIRALEELAGDPRVDSRSQVVIFYSGHGLRNGPDSGLRIPERGVSYALVPYDYASFDYRQGEGLIWDGELSRLLSGLRPRQMWISIDSCFSGGFDRPGISGPGRVVTMSSAADELSSEMDGAGHGVMSELMVDEGIAHGLSVEDSFARAAAQAGSYGQHPRISRGYAGYFRFSEASETPHSTFFGMLPMR